MPNPINFKKLRQNNLLIAVLLVVTAVVLMYLYVSIKNLIQQTNIETPKVQDQHQTDDEKPTKTNIILLIGDGMGPKHLELAMQYSEKEYGFSSCPHTEILTDSLTLNSATDSAAAATAIATGNKVNNGVISMAIPGNEQALKTILEYANEKGLSTGIVTTTEITHATPAAFATHTNSRNNYQEIFNQYINNKVPNVLMGGLNKDVDSSALSESNFTLVTSTSALDNSETEQLPLIGIFNSTGHIPYVSERDTNVPTLTEMTLKAIELLETDEEGFLLVVEGGRIDHQSHNNNVDGMLDETTEFLETIEAITNWIVENPNTLVIITADHETGGLDFTQMGTVAETINTVKWSSTGHTNSNVPLYICGTTQPNLDLEAIKHHVDTYGIMHDFLSSN